MSPQSAHAAKPQTACAPLAPGADRFADARPLAVLKFGHSVLTDADKFAIPCNEIYALTRKGWRVVAVASAVGSETAELIAQGAALGDSVDEAGLPMLLRLGELRSSAMLALALSRIGLKSRAIDPSDIGLVAQGRALDAAPIALDCARLAKLTLAHDVLVLPGFIAHGQCGALHTLGRGGSDLTAVFVAHACSAERLRLFKDVDGVYDADPNAPDSHARRFAEVDYDTVARVGAQVVQPKALNAAAAAGVAVEVGACGSHVPPTVVAAVAPRMHEPRPPAAKRRVALLGAGTVGRGVYNHLARYPERFAVTGVLCRDLDKHARAGLSRSLLLDNPAGLGAHDLLVEAMGGLKLSGQLVTAALERGVDVVTANKSLIARDYERLHALAERSGAMLRYSAAVGGGAPVLETLERARALGEVVALEAVLNGTSNFVLGKLGEGESVADAVAEAQAKGFAEADPSADIDGVDAAEKLAILARHAFGCAVDVDAIARDKLADLSAEAVKAARASGKVIKQVARARRAPGSDVVALDVSLRAVDARGLLGATRNEEVAAVITLADGREITVGGKGAGRWPTAESAFADVMEIMRARGAAGAADGEVGDAQAREAIARA